jgi:hypothetical protein
LAWFYDLCFFHDSFIGSVVRPDTDILQKKTISRRTRPIGNDQFVNEDLAHQCHQWIGITTVRRLSGQLHHAPFPSTPETLTTQSSSLSLSPSSSLVSSLPVMSCIAQPPSPSFDQLQPLQPPASPEPFPQCPLIATSPPIQLPVSPDPVPQPMPHSLTDKGSFRLVMDADFQVLATGQIFKAVITCTDDDKVASLSIAAPSAASISREFRIDAFTVLVRTADPADHSNQTLETDLIRLISSPSIVYTQTYQVDDDNGTIFLSLRLLSKGTGREVVGYTLFNSGTRAEPLSLDEIARLKERANAMMHNDVFGGHVDRFAVLRKAKELVQPLVGSRVRAIE